MLAAQYKISQTEFKNFYNKGIKKSSENIRVSLVFDEKTKKSKYAVIVSKKIAKTAVLRNKNKRKIYKILRQLYPQFLTIKYGFIFVQRDISTASEKALKQELISLFTKK